MNILTLGNSLDTYLVIGAVLFGIGLYGIVKRRTFIGMLISAELMLSGASVNFMAFNRFLAPTPVTGQVFTLFIMAIAAAEAAIVLSIIIAVYRNYRSIETNDVVDLKG
ncbi:NADH-quinone oxidoreductase subunit NuoK [Fundidesulfovibrio putealis]|jgi:NADH-quinone oxidoreductase subunit K|uniref:NADH-quinone oxidoreductase subunit NuoK n=1 Tax=Fundidesulfovibrio putealis TaxID=270496 RepID=UPI00041EBFE5|nr:NADH-quinone oxidoreductase subunit NuoK [Fundidesulfovibrio putealis]KAF0234653.1 MAG: NADH-quinone oxidoreductase subunit [Desulfovibrionaceae bacterium]